MNKKKLVALFLAATTVSTMVFAGCGSTEEKKETSTEKTDDTKPDKDQTLNLVGYDYTFGESEFAAPNILSKRSSPLLTWCNTIRYKLFPF